MTELLNFFSKNASKSRTTSYALVGNILNDWKGFQDAVYASYNLPVAEKLKKPFLDRTILRPLFEILGQRFTDVDSLSIETGAQLLNPGIRKYAMLFGEQMSSMATSDVEAGNYVFYGKYLIVYDKSALAKHLAIKGLTAELVDHRHFLELLPAEIQGVLQQTEYTIVSSQDLEMITGGNYTPAHVMKKFSGTVNSTGKTDFHQLLRNAIKNYKHFVETHLTKEDVRKVLDGIKFDSKLVDGLRQYVIADKSKLMSVDTIIQDLWMRINDDNNVIVDEIKNFHFTKAMDMSKENVCLTEAAPRVNYPRSDFASGVEMVLDFISPASQTMTTLKSFKLLAGVAMYDNSYSGSLAVADKPYEANTKLSLEAMKLLEHHSLTYRFGLDKQAIRQVHEDFTKGIIYHDSARGDIITQSALLPGVDFGNSNNIVAEFSKRNESSDTTFLPLDFQRSVFNWYGNSNDGESLFDRSAAVAKDFLSFQMIYNGSNEDAFIPNMIEAYLRSIVGSKQITFRAPLPNGSSTYEVKSQPTTLPEFIFDGGMEKTSIDYQRYMFWMSLFDRTYDIQLFQNTLMVASNYHTFLNVYADELFKSLKFLVSDTQTNALWMVIKGTTNLQKLKYMTAKQALTDLCKELSNRELYIVISRIQELMELDDDVVTASYSNLEGESAIAGSLSIIDVLGRENSSKDGLGDSHE